MTALLLLASGTPMLFQGQEFAASSPFLYFADLNPDIVPPGAAGTHRVPHAIREHTFADVLASLDNPSSRATFERSRLDLTERQQNPQVYVLHRDLIKLRREDPVFNKNGTGSVEGAVLGPEAFVIRYFAAGLQRLLLVNLGRDLHCDFVAEPLLAPPEESRWELVWSSERVEYGKVRGTPELETNCFFRIPGHAALVVLPTPTGDTL